MVLEVIVALINNILIANIFRVATYSYYYGTTYAVSGFGAAIQGILNLAVWVITLIYVIIGIKNAISNENKKLPLIGDWAFYK